MDQIKAHAGGTTFAEISKRQFRPLPFLVPDAAALAEFAAVVKPSFDSIAAYARESRTLTAIKDALLPKLISGEARVADTADWAEVIMPLAAGLAVR